jgi:hypothetical protein
MKHSAIGNSYSVYPPAGFKMTRRGMGWTLACTFRLEIALKPAGGSAISPIVPQNPDKRCQVGCGNMTMPLFRNRW